MKYLYITLFLVLTSTYSQVKKDKLPAFPPKCNGKIRKTKKEFNYLNFGDLKKNSDSLYCWRINDRCNILDGKTIFYSYYLTESDTPTLIPYTSAKGEFLNGKYHGKWLFYDKTKKIIKTEIWNKGFLKSTKN